MMDWTGTILFNMGPYPVMVIDLITSLLGLSCVFLAGRNSKYNFWVGYLYTLALFLLFWNNKLYASLLLQPISLAINVIGHWRWTHPAPVEESSEDPSALRVSMLSNPERVILVLLMFVVAALWGWTLDTLFPEDPHPYLDSCVTMSILLAQLLSAMKKWECWFVWLFVNLSQIALHLSVGNVFMPVVCSLYLINGLVSLWHWYNLYRRKA